MNNLSGNKRPRLRDCGFVLLLMLLGMSFSIGAGDGPSQALDEATALESFDQVWTQVQAQYFDFERIEADWKDARSELRPLAGQASSIPELRTVLNQLLEVIGESHFNVIPAELMNPLRDLSDDSDGASSGPASTGISVRLVEGLVRVTQVSQHSAGWQAGIRPGWALTAINDHEVADRLEELAEIEDEAAYLRGRLLLQMTLQGLLAFPDADRTLALSFVDMDGQVQKRDLTGDALGVDLVQLGNLPPMPFAFQFEKIEQGDHCLVLLAFSTWVPELNEAIRQHRDEIFQCEGLVIDLGGNPGGVLTTMVTLAADLFEEPVTLGSLMRADGQIDFRVLPRRVAMDGTRLQPFTGPIAILIDGLSASTSEMFAGGMQANGRARLFGDTSAGMALPAQVLPLANGDMLMYAFADYRDRSQRRIEGVGVVPDEPVALTAAELNQNQPPALRAALTWMSEQLNDKQSPNP